MKCENELKIGDVVKSLDFVGVNNCYYIGLVTEIRADNVFVAKTIKRVWEGEIDKKFLTETFVAPLPGTHFFDDLWGREPRIQVIA